MYFIQRLSSVVAFMHIGLQVAHKTSRFFKICLFFFFGSQQLSAEVLINMEVQQGANISTVYLKLFEADAPFTVGNFLKYVDGATVNKGNYANSFIQRSATNFVIQGGGFTFDPSVNNGSFTSTYDANLNLYAYAGGLQEIPEDLPVQNEFKRSNLRGTIAMAKLVGDPHSATSEWFINLADNSLSLDAQNGGFTVFGEVVADGMVLMDEIAAHTKFNKNDIHPAFAELPLINYVADPIQQENLVRVNTMNKLLSISSDIDFKPVLLNTPVTSDIIIKNIDSVSHSIGNIASIDAINAPFSIIADTCLSTTLAPNGECALTIQFSPLKENLFNDTFNIELTDLALSYSFSLAGEGVVTPPAPQILPSLSAVEFGEDQLYDPLNGLPSQIVLYISNNGNLDLNITSVSLGGIDALDFQITDNCTTYSPVAPTGYCVIPINFKPLTVGVKSAELTFTSNDLYNSPLVIPITGTASVDTDGIAEAIEDAGSNYGDGNNDGILDSVQNVVASFPAINGSYISLLTTSANTINNISVLTEDQVAPLQDNIHFNLGLLDFTVEDVQVGGIIEVGIILPSEIIPTTYYMYGVTPDNLNPHWYEFLFDGETGAQLLGKVKITSPDGVGIERNIIKLIFKDGGRGDADLATNGVVIGGIGGPVLSSGSSDSGSLNALLLLYLSGIIVLLRLISRNDCQ